MTLSKEDLDDIYQFAVQLGKDAGAILMDRARLRYEDDSNSEIYTEKENAVDIVTKADEGTSRSLQSSMLAGMRC
jgi:myo-inositol-1(or 4)-monophosphatase